MAVRVLIVDDNPTNLKLASDVLASEGFAVDSARDAEEARRLLAQRLPDMILMDIALPGMDGLTLTRLLKAESRYARIPIVALTADVVETGRQACQDVGMDGFLTKPIDTAELDAMFAKLFPAETRSAAA